jgi:hypothetical protein
MLPATYSAHRAWASGMGDCPSEPVQSEGNQFIAADPPLWNDWIAKPLGQRLLSLSHSEDELRWVAFPCGKWYFVASLRGAARPTYFAHARGWLTGEWDDPVQDPGAWLGDLDAFDSPWRDPANRPPDRIQPVEKSVRAWREPVDQESVTAQRLLACLYRAVEQRSTVVWRVPSADFRRESPVVRLVAFARAALPLDLKKQVAISVNVTSDDALSPEDLAGQGVHLLVLNESEAVPRVATVLDRRLSLQRGTEAPPAYRSYADWATAGFLQDPDALLRFSVLAAERLPRCSQAPSTAAMEEASRVVYNLAQALGRSRLDSLFKKSILPESQSRQDLTLDWRRLIADGDCAALQPDTLEQLALMEAPTPDSRCLRSRFWDALRAQGIKLDDAVERWWAPDLAHAQTLLDIASETGDGLCSNHTASALLGTLPAVAMEELLLDAGRGRTLLQLAPAQLPEHWCEPALYDLPRAEKLFVVVAGPRDFFRWLRWLYACVERMADLPALSSETLRLIKQLPLPGRDTPLSVKLAYGELCARYPETETMARMLAESIPAHLSGQQDTQEILARFESGRSRFLTDYLPTRWILEKAGESPSASLLRQLDRRMVGDQFVQEACWLLDSGLWMAWRMATALPRESLAKSAAGWLQANPGDPALEEWKQVLADFATEFSAENLRSLKRTGVPWISGFEMEQMEDLHRRSADLEADIEIHHLRSPVANEFPETASRWMKGLPTDTLRRLIERRLLKLAEARQLLQNPGRQCENVMERYVEAWLDEIASSGGLPASEAEWLWVDALFCRMLTWRISQLYQERPPGRSPQFWKALDERIRPGPVTPDFHHHDLVFKLHEGGFSRIAQFLDPASKPAPRVAKMQPASAAQSDPFQVALAEALAAGCGDAPVWRDLGGRVSYAHTVAVHPIQAAANYILGLSEKQRRAIEESGWEAYQRAAAMDGRLLEAATREGALPAYSLLAAIKPAWTCGQVALSILLAMRERGDEVTDCWLRALVWALCSVRHPGFPGIPGDRMLAVANLSRACRRLDLPLSTRNVLVAAEKYGLRKGAIESMSNQLILFGSREQSPLRWRQPEPSEHGALLYAFSGDAPPSEIDKWPTAEAIADALRKRPGILIRTRPPNQKGIGLDVIVGIDRPGNLPARALQVDLLGKTDWIELEPQDLYIQPQQALVVPASRELEAQLDQLCKNLDLLPPDHRLSMLYALVMPNLEVRVASLEAFKAEMEERRSRPVTLVDAGTDWLRRRDGWLIALVALVFLFAGLVPAYLALKDNLEYSTSTLEKALRSGGGVAASKPRETSPADPDQGGIAPSLTHTKNGQNPTRSHPKDQK